MFILLRFIDLNLFEIIIYKDIIYIDNLKLTFIFFCFKKDIFRLKNKNNIKTKH
jgi:hypothetical protein